MTFPNNAPIPFAGETNGDYRARMERFRAEKIEQRERDILAQASTLSPPTERIRLWEHLHQVNLPRDPNHRLVAVIAANTGLTLQEVLDEQRERAPKPVA
jgi:hypothetical protein